MKVYCIFIVINEEQYIEATMRSYMKRPEVAGIAITEGADRLYKAATFQGFSQDYTQQVAFSLIHENGEYKKSATYSMYGWAQDKAELWNNSIRLLRDELELKLKSEDWILLCCGDEIYRDDQWELLIGAMKANPNAGAIYITPYHFWKDFKHITMGSQWDKAMPRAFRYCDDSVNFIEHNLPPYVDGMNKLDTNVSEFGVLYPAIHVHHYGAVKPTELVQAKLAYYQERDKELHIEDTYTNYREGQPTQWTHGGGYVVETRMGHPVEINELINNKEWRERWGV